MFRDKYNLFLFHFALLFCLIPYRISGIFYLDLYWRLSVLFLSFSFFYYMLKNDREAIPSFLNLRIVQAFFYHFLRFENFVLGMHPVLMYVFLLTLGFNLGAWPSFLDDPTFYYLVFLFSYSFYSRLKTIFLDSDFVGSIYPLLNKSSMLTWEIVIENISSICFYFFGNPITNQLGSQAAKKNFHQISKRYMFSRVMQGLKTNPDVVAICTSVGGVLGYTISEINQGKRHEDVIRQSVQANAESARGNALREVELGLRTKEEYKASYSQKAFSCDLDEKIYFYKIFGWISIFF